MSSLRHIVVILLVGIAAVGCTGEELMARISDAERIAESDPSTALRIMRTIDRDDIYGEEDNARYALVYSEALYYGDVTVDSDTLTHSMMLHYLTSSNHSERVRALYHHALVAHAAGHNADAMYSLMESVSSFAHDDNYRCQGLIYRTMGDIYNDEWMFGNALDSYASAIECFDRANLPEHSAYARYSLAMIYETITEYDIAEELVHDVIERAESIDDNSLICLALHMLCDIYIQTDRLSLCRDIVEKIDNLAIFTFYTSHFYLVKAIVAANDGNYSEAERFIAEAEKYPNDKNDDIEYFKYRVYELLNNSDLSFYWFRQSKEIQDRAVLDVLYCPILKTEISFVKNKLFEEQQHAKSIRLKYISCLVLAVAGLGLLIIYIGVRLRRRQHEIEQYIANIRELQLIKQGVSDELSTQVVNIYKERFTELNSICDTYYEHMGQARHASLVFNQLQQIIDSFKNDTARLSELEDIVNRCNNDIMKILRSEYPKLSELQYRLALYLYAGFSLRAISLFIDSTPVAVSKLKYKLKTKITDGGSPHSEELLRYL